jgi:hypothetical protein
LPKDLPAHKYFTRFPIPRPECIIRPTPPNGCDPEDGQ